MKHIVLIAVLLGLLGGCLWGYHLYWNEEIEIDPHVGVESFRFIGESDNWEISLMAAPAEDWDVDYRSLSGSTDITVEIFTAKLKKPELMNPAQGITITYQVRASRFIAEMDAFDRETYQFYSDSDRRVFYLFPDETVQVEISIDGEVEQIELALDKKKRRK